MSGSPPSPSSLSSCLLPPLFASLTFSPAFPLPRGSGRRAYRWTKFKAEHQKAERVGESQAATSCPGRVGTEGCAVLPSSTHPFAPLPFYLPLPGPPTPTGISHTELGSFLGLTPPPLSVWRPSKGPLTSLIYVVKVPGVLSVFM